MGEVMGIQCKDMHDFAQRKWGFLVGKMAVGGCPDKLEGDYAHLFDKPVKICYTVLNRS